MDRTACDISASWCSSVNKQWRIHYGTPEQGIRSCNYHAVNNKLTVERTIRQHSTAIGSCAGQLKANKILSLIEIISHAANEFDWLVGDFPSASQTPDASIVRFELHASPLPIRVAFRVG